MKVPMQQILMVFFDRMAVSETSAVAVMEVWLIDSPDPKPNASWATMGPLQSFCTWCSLVQ